jgi:drug/metabolite transporter (DMT)-like permease
MAKQGIKIKNKGMFLIGVILLVIGVILSLYNGDSVMQTTYPYQVAGIILIVAGLVLMVLGFLYSPRYLITAFQRNRAQQSPR